MEAENFRLLHTLLYAKHWYKERRYLPDKYMPLYYDKDAVMDEDEKLACKLSKSYSFEYKNVFRGIWWDLAKVMKADLGEAYYFNPYAENGSGNIIPDVDYMINFLVSESDKLFKITKPQNNPLDLLNVRKGISKYECHRYGYYFKGSVWDNRRNSENEYDPDEALVWYILSNLSMVEVKHIGGKLPKPDYKNVLPRKQKMTDKKLTEFWS